MLATSHILGSIHAIFVTILLEDGVLIFLAATEAISVLENCSRITGMPIPAWLSKKLRGIASNPTEKK
jgi:phage-related holin